jgi:S-adenosylmethionine hydrolase
VALPARSGQGPVGSAGATFDGRDVFAPAAAALWRGEAFEALGDPVGPEELVALAEPRLSVLDGELEAEVLWVDRFGNVQLAATAADGHAAGIVVGAGVEVHAASRGRPARVVRAFGELEDAVTGVEPALGVLVDANGRLAVVCARSSAATVLGVQAGEIVRLRRVAT